MAWSTTRCDFLFFCNSALLDAVTTGHHTAAGLLSQPVTNGGTISTDLDALVDAIATIEDASGVATHIIASPEGWAELSKFKDQVASNRSGRAPRRPPAPC
jgi:hypothetical protein